jgi:hypothetical protein
VPPDLLEGLRREPAGHAHALDGPGVLDVSLAAARGTPADIFRALDACRNGALRRNPAGLESGCHDLQV